MIYLHANAGIPWHLPFARRMTAGLRRIGIDTEITGQITRIDDGCAILLGTSCWRAIEATGDYLLVDRCSFGDTNKYVSLVFNGHGRRGDHRVPLNIDNYESRWRVHGVPLAPFNHDGSKFVCCGQMEAYSKRVGYLDALDWWYDNMQKICTHFRPHPAALADTMRPNLPTWSSWNDVGVIATFNSSVAVEALVRGIWANVDDEGGMAHGWNAGAENIDDARIERMHWLAWTQWHHDEIELGAPIRHLFDE